MLQRCKKLAALVDKDADCLVLEELFDVLQEGLLLHDKFLAILDGFKKFLFFVIFIHLGNV